MRVIGLDVCRTFAEIAYLEAGTLKAGGRAYLHRIERLMTSAGLKARRARRRRPTDAGPRIEHTIAGNVLDRQFEAIGPNLKWTADFTYLWTHEGWLFVAMVIDLFSRRIVGWSSNARMCVFRSS